MAWTDLMPSMHAALVDSDLGEPVTFVEPVEGEEEAEEVEVRAIYARPPVITEQGGVDYRGAAHEVSVRASDLPEWVDRDTVLEARGITLAVIDQAPDGEGMVKLTCRRVTP
jgi:hypothetical protein